jgi:hypothetical protein
MENSIALLAAELKQRQDTTSHTRIRKIFQLPILKISSLPVMCFVSVTKSEFQLEISSSKCTTTDENGYITRKRIHIYKDADAVKMAEYILEKLPTFKFNKFNSSFTDFDDDKLFTIFEPILDCETIDFKYGKCSACQDYTMSKTCCGHFLCLECWGKIPRNYCEDCDFGLTNCDCEPNECGIKKCPICRKNLELEVHDAC